MSIPIALQLYSVRDSAVRDFEGTLRRVAEMGYAGVETAGFPNGISAAHTADLCKSLGLQICSAHTPLPVGAEKNHVLDEVQALGCKRLISGVGPESFKTADGLRAAIDLLNEAGAAARECGLSFGMHNHWWEFQQLDGRWIHRELFKRLNRDIFFELDIYWIQTAGQDPAEMVKEFGKRAPLLHIKDGPCDLGKPMVAVGEGAVDVPAVISAGKKWLEWLIVELDACATDMFTAVHASHQYLTSHGLGHGRN